MFTQVNTMFIDRKQLKINNLFMHESMIRIEKLLQAQEMDWADFARLLNVKKQHINNWKNRGISKNKAIEAAEKLNTPVDSILCKVAEGSAYVQATSSISAAGSKKLGTPNQVKESGTSYPVSVVDYNLLESCIEDIEAATLLVAQTLSPKLKSRAITALYKHRLENGMQAMPNDVELSMSIITSIDH